MKKIFLLIAINTAFIPSSFAAQIASSNSQAIKANSKTPANIFQMLFNRQQMEDGAVHCSLERKQIQILERRFFEAVQENDYPKVKEMLDQYNVDPSELDDKGRSPLSYAAEKGYIEVARLLLERGACMSAGDRDTGMTHLMHAAQEGHVGMVELLLAKGADPRAEDTEGWNVDYYASIGHESSPTHIRIRQLLEIAITALATA